MRVRRVLFVLIMGCCFVLSTCASGGGEQVIRRPAKEMNLTGAELGSAYTLGQEPDWERIRGDLTAQEAQDSFDGSTRYFHSADGMVISLVLSFNSSSAAEKHLSDVFDGFENSFKQQMPGAVFRPVALPVVGDQVAMSGVTLTDPPLQLYVLAFRQTNVVNVMALVGPQGTTTVQSAIETAQKVGAKIK